jgi:hypothetical protein
MQRLHRTIVARKLTLLTFVFVGIVFLHAGIARSEDVADSESKQGSLESPKNTPASGTPTLAPPKGKLSPELRSLCDEIQKTLSQHARQNINTRQNSASEIIDYSLSYGCKAEITLIKSTGNKRENAISCLCWNVPCAGYELLKVCDGRIVARLGYGAQRRPSHFLAMLAFAQVQSSYPLRVGETQQTVANLVDGEKLQCRTGADLSMTLIGLSHYAENSSWKNDLGEEWSVERLLREELDKPATAATDGDIDRLLGIAYVLNHRKQHNLPLDGDYERAEKYLEELHGFAMNLQNKDGSWGYYLSRQGVNPEETLTFNSTAYVLEWLSLSIPREQLEDPRMIAGVKYLLRIVNNNRYQRDIAGLTAREIGAYTRSLHALSLFLERCPIDSKEKTSS